MKKIYTFIIVIAFLLFGCDPAGYYFRKDEYIVKIESIELIKYRNYNYYMTNPLKEIVIYNPDNAVVIEVLEENLIEVFLLEFENIIFHVENKSVNEPTGYCLLWHLFNGNFIVFSCTMIEGDRAYSMVAEFTSTNEFVKHYGYFAARPYFEQILEDYFKNYEISI